MAAQQEDLLIDDGAFEVDFYFVRVGFDANFYDSVFVTPETTLQNFFSLVVGKIKNRRVTDAEKKKFVENLEPNKILFIQLPNGRIYVTQKGGLDPTKYADPENTTMRNIGLTSAAALRNPGPGRNDFISIYTR
jgi:hypothetical protein